MHEICQEAAMSPGALYRYFRSKDEIIQAIADADRDRNRAILTQGCDGVGFIDRTVQIALTFLREMARPGAAALLAEVMSECLRNSAIGNRFRENERECRAFFRQSMEEAVASGEIEAVADFDATMSCLMATGEGLVFRLAFDPSLTIDQVEPVLRLMALALFKPAAPSGGNFT
jgi:AcrR family transcriptional regulator